MTLRTQSVAAGTDVVGDRRCSTRRDRYEARKWLRRESSLRRVQTCGRWAVGDAVSVKVSATADGRRAGLGGVVSCGSVWACPVCSEKVNAGRQAELSAGIAGWLAGGRHVVFGTLTMRHNKGHKLKDLWDGIGPAWNRVTSGAGRQWKEDKARFGIAGYVRVVETKHGANGWHPHVHFLLFLEQAVTDSALLDLERRMFGRWETALAKKGFSVVESVGIDLRRVGDGDKLGEYFTKGTYTSPGGAAYEVTGSHSKTAGKGGRTPFEILAGVVGSRETHIRDEDSNLLYDPATGEVSHDLTLWHEWERASKGRRQLTWSRGLRALLALGVEKTDEELVDEDNGGTEEASIGKKAWKWIAVEPGRVCEVLETIEADESGWRIHRLLTGWGLQVLGGERSTSRRYDLP